jgi:hypothetical protein
VGDFDLLQIVSEDYCISIFKVSSLIYFLTGDFFLIVSDDFCISTYSSGVKDFGGLYFSGTRFSLKGSWLKFEGGTFSSLTVFFK